jgi:tetratricopeptide (TPR) repeat protein
VSVLGAGALGALAFALYVPSFGFALVGLDDHVMVVQDHTLNADPGTLVGAFSGNFYDTYYRPLHRISFVVDALRAGLQVPAYHHTNALLHAVGTAAVFAALLALGYARPLALALGAVWAVHPVLASCVAWIPGRDNMLVTIFLLGSLIALHRHLSAPRASAFTPALALHWLLLAAGLLCKEAAFSFPGVALAFAWLWHREPLLSRRVVVAALGWVAVLAGFLALRAQALPQAQDAEAFGLDALLRSAPVPLAMLGKWVLPIRLSAFSNLEWTSLVTGLAAAPAAAVLTLRCDGVRGRRVLFGAAWFGILLLPTLLQRTGLYDYGEYRLYWLGFGLLLVCAEILAGLGALQGRRPVDVACAVLVVVLLAARTWSYQTVFDGPLRFWGQMVELDPANGWGWFHIGRAHYTDGDLDAALDAYERAVAADFERVDLYVDLAAVRLDREQWQRAASAAERAVALEPGNVFAQANLGSALQRLGHHDAALRAFAAALSPQASRHFRYAPPEDEPRFRARIHEQRGISLHALGEPDAAEREWAQATRLDPSRHASYRHRIKALLEQGRIDDARRAAAELRAHGGDLPPALRQRLRAE